MKKLVIFGAEDFAEVARYLFDHDSEYETVAFTVDSEYVRSPEFCGLPLVGFERVEELYPPSECEMFLAIGYSKVNRAREQKYKEAKQKGYRLATYVSSKATVWDTLKIGDNSFVFEHNNIQPFVEIGSNVVLWSGNQIAHHSIIGDHVFIASHAVVSGRCVVGDYCFIGANATLHDHVKVAPRTVIGAGALISHDTEADSVYKLASTEKYKRTSSQLHYLGGTHE